MKKTLLLLTALAGFLAHQLSAQTITVSGSSHTVSPGDVFNVSITLTVQPSSLGSNVTALNLLLATPSSGASSGVGFFTVDWEAGGSDYPNRVGPGTTSAFDTAGTGANAGFTISSPGNDLGSSGTGQAAPFSNVVVSILQFTVDASTPFGTYDFRATLGWDTDSEGSFINVANNNGPQAGGTYAVNDAPVFSVTVVPEPSTWALIAVGGMASLGMTALRRRKS